VRIILTHIKG